MNMQDSQIKKLLEAGKSKEEVIKLLSDEQVKQERIEEIKQSISNLEADTQKFDNKINKLVEELNILKGEYKIGDKVKVVNVKNYDILEKDEVAGEIYKMWEDGDIGVQTESGGSIKAKPEDIIKAAKDEYIYWDELPKHIKDYFLAEYDESDKFKKEVADTIGSDVESIKIQETPNFDPETVSKENAEKGIYDITFDFSVEDSKSKKSYFLSGIITLKDEDPDAKLQSISLSILQEDEIKAKQKIKATLGLKDTVEILAKIQAELENEKYSSGISMLKELIKSLNKFGMNVPLDYDPKEGKIKADTYDDAREAYEIMTNSDNRYRAYKRLKERFINTYSDEALQRLKALWQSEMEDAFIADIERRLEKGKIKASTRHEQLDKLKDALKCDLLVDSIVDAMSDEAFNEIYKWIVRMNDIEIEGKIKAKLADVEKAIRSYLDGWNKNRKENQIKIEKGLQKGSEPSDPMSQGHKWFSFSWTHGTSQTNMDKDINKIKKELTKIIKQAEKEFKVDVDFDISEYSMTIELR